MSWAAKLMKAPMAANIPSASSQKTYLRFPARMEVNGESVMVRMGDIHRPCGHKQPRHHRRQRQQRHEAARFAVRHQMAGRKINFGQEMLSTLFWKAFAKLERRRNHRRADRRPRTR